MLKRCVILRTIGPQHKYYIRLALIAPIGDKLLLPSLSCKCLCLGNIYHFNTTHKETALRDNTLALMLFCINLDPCFN